MLVATLRARAHPAHLSLMSCLVGGVVGVPRGWVGALGGGSSHPPRGSGPSRSAGFRLVPFSSVPVGQGRCAPSPRHPARVGARPGNRCHRESPTRRELVPPATPAPGGLSPGSPPQRSPPQLTHPHRSTAAARCAWTHRRPEPPAAPERPLSDRGRSPALSWWTASSCSILRSLLIACLL